ncbi:MotA/TolQ/ExbB proton channel family protein [Tenacibaculum sp. HL-MS23]|uniref:MotA/TolQ/ExbB proton channel family protein n=1 Tax=Tenacibaculum sp. HL-MS23 TaxID=3077734 RepID=UPI0028FC16F9|nr:MotA/TolQ/ExbB proton channel family protein [Tenacibaculum sp. HL-MS23]WNW01583.1 MotA/TolQ/ExbB proton channel family protein [Tenacibaculum sp. HL-MS23]
MNFLIINLLQDGGAMFMYPLLFILIICIALIAKAFLRSTENDKVVLLIKHISLFALVYGFFGFMMGMIQAFDSISSLNGDIASPILAGGLKIGLLSPSFGMFVFLITRLGLIGLTLKNNKH